MSTQEESVITFLNDIIEGIKTGKISFQDAEIVAHSRKEQEGFLWKEVPTGHETITITYFRKK